MDDLHHIEIDDLIKEIEKDILNVNEKAGDYLKSKEQEGRQKIIVCHTMGPTQLYFSQVLLPATTFSVNFSEFIYSGIVNIVRRVQAKKATIIAIAKQVQLGYKLTIYF